MNDHIRGEIVRLHREGKLLREISQDVGFSTSAVHAFLVRVGEREVKRTTAPMLKVIQDYASGESAHVVARRYGIAQTTVLVWARAYNVPIRPPSVKPRVPSKTIAHLHESGWSFARIAKFYGLCDSTTFKRYHRWKNRKSSPGTSKPTASDPAT